MKKLTLILGLLAVVIVAGFASTRLHKPQTAAFKPHTIIYHVTAYDEAGKVTESNVLVRRVFADGSWQHTQALQNGTVLTPRGQLKNILTTKGLDSSMPESLGYRYIVEKSAGSESWLSPELQDYLRFTVLRPNGSKESSLEAVDVSLP